MKIRITVQDQVVLATLYDTAGARDFAALLPLVLTLEDYAEIERISMLPRKLSAADAPSGAKPETGDIMYYAPWGNLAIFLQGTVYARGLMPIGKVDEGLAVLRQHGPFQVRIERASQ